MKKRWIAAVMAVIMSVCMFAGCGSTNTGTQKDGDNTQKSAEDVGKKGTINVTYVKSPLNVPSIVEKEQGIFEKNFKEMGYDVAYSDLTTGPEQTAALASGDIQFLFAVGATSVILSASNGADIKIISTYSRSPKAFCLFSSDDSIKSPKDLKGKKVAGPKGTILHELLVAYLATDGLTIDDIDFIDMTIPDAQAALTGKSVDAALQAGAAAYNMENDGYNKVTDGEGLTEATIVVATSGKYAAEHLDEVQTFLDSQKEILAYIDANKDTALETSAKDVELEKDAVEQMYPMYDFDMEIRDSDIEAMEKTQEFMLETGMIENAVSIEEIIYK